MKLLKCGYDISHSYNVLILIDDYKFVECCSFYTTLYCRLLCFMPVIFYWSSLRCDLMLVSVGYYDIFIFGKTA
jgi:hypothetical protein